MFELQINGPKTEILEIPEPIEPEWKTELQLSRIFRNERATGIKAFFDRAALLAQQYRNDSVLTYAVRKLVHYASNLNEEEWRVARPSLLRFCIAEPTMLPHLLNLFEATGDSYDREDLRDVLTELCLFHGPLQHGFEVAWSLWIARSMSIDLPQSVSATVKNVDDDIVALVALDLVMQGLLPSVNTRLWSSRIRKESLYSEHWLLAYEAYAQGWLPSGDGSNILNDDPFFSILYSGGVKFYDVGETWEDGYSDYSESDDDIDETENELDDEIEIEPEDEIHNEIPVSEA
ncbi:MAG TPA: hypothetical protein VGL97_10815 [Bryobacteraceae bacterium]|jgi:hypothetical protein